MSELIPLTRENDVAVERLRERMDAFYASAVEYSAFQNPSAHPQEWAHVHDAILERAQRPGVCRVLEVGAGRTGFAAALGELRSSVHFTAHDVTSFNADYLRAEADAVQIGALPGSDERFDVIFSTFVLEHVSDPERSLETLFGLLNPGGVLIVFCPRYDFPFYISHSADHYGVVRRLVLALYVAARRVGTLLGGRPAFLIHHDPALFHLPWAMDRDAIHWASQLDLRALFRRRGEVRELPLPSGGRKDWFVKNLLRINVAITRKEA
jgi:SAM-dependent methyltransferase